MPKPTQAHHPLRPRPRPDNLPPPTKPNSRTDLVLAVSAGVPVLVDVPTSAGLGASSFVAWRLLDLLLALLPLLLPLAFPLHLAFKKRLAGPSAGFGLLLSGHAAGVFRSTLSGGSKADFGGGGVLLGGRRERRGIGGKETVGAVGGGRWRRDGALGGNVV